MEKCSAKNCENKAKYGLVGLPALQICDLLKIDLHDVIYVCEKHFEEAWLLLEQVKNGCV